MTKIKMKPTHFSVLKALTELESPTILDVANFAHMSSETAAAAMRELETKELMDIEKPHKFGRAKRTLTDKGRQALTDEIARQQEPPEDVTQQKALPRTHTHLTTYYKPETSYTRNSGNKHILSAGYPT